MFRKPFFWIVFCILSLLAAIYTIKNLPTAMSLLQVDISMSRSGSLSAADSLHALLGIELDGYRQATMFTSESSFQNYIELKAGGKDAFSEILQTDDFKPYYWYVRHFREEETREFRAYFTPAGEFYGFEEKVPENEEGASLERAEALAIADSSAQFRWGLDLSKYTLIESAQEERPNGRIDHTFTYEMNEEELSVDIGEADYRLRLTVSGDRFTALRYFVRVPDSFNRKFMEMYSFNITLTFVAMGLLALLYGSALVCWLVTYIKRKYLIFKPALKWVIAVGVIGLVSSLSYFSFYWFSYDTSTSANSFIFQRVLIEVMGAVFMGAVLLLLFMVAEGVTRQALPKQVRFWNLMDRDVTPTKTVLGYVSTAYFLLPLELAFITAFYIFTSSRLGWWIPSSVIENPNILGAVFPSISAINLGLSAGFMEEMLFRALPLATMAILGVKFNKRKLFLIIGLIVQAFIFSAVHAGYPQQPYYFRLVELIIPSLVFAFLYLKLNLVVAILFHFGFNSVLAGSSIFVMQAPGLWFDRVVFIILFFLPLLFILFRRWQSNDWRSKEKISVFGSVYRYLFVNWGEVPDSKLNAGDSKEENQLSEVKIEETEIESPEDNLEESEKQDYQPVKHQSILTLVKALPFVIIVYLSGWFIISDINRPQEVPQPKLQITATEAVQIANDALEEWLGTEIPEEFTPYPEVFRTDQTTRYFILSRNGKAAYNELRDKYLLEDAWRVMYKRFEGTMDERTEHFTVLMNSGGDLLSIHHSIAEDEEGAELTEEEARLIAMEELAGLPGYEQMGIREISVTPRERPNRIDWFFVFTDTLYQVLEVGEPRIRVSITGDRATALGRYVFIPEEVNREISSYYQKADTIKDIAIIIVVGLILSGLIVGIIKLAHKQIDASSFRKVFLIMFIFTALNTIITWRYKTGRFFTFEPYNNQLTMMLIGVALQMVFVSGFFALFFSLASHWQKTREPEPLGKTNKWLLILSSIILLALIIPFTGKSVYTVNILNIPEFTTVLSANQTLYLLISNTRLFLLDFCIICYLFFAFEKLLKKGKVFSVLAVLMLVLFSFSQAISLRLLYYTEPFTRIVPLLGITITLVLYISYTVLSRLKENYWIAGFLLYMSIHIIKNASMNRFVGARFAYLLSYLIMIVIFLFLFRNRTKAEIPGEIEGEAN